MKYDFTYYNPTRVHFGKNAITNLAGELSNFGKNILLIYGKGAIKKIGLYDTVLQILKDAGKTVSELPGIKPNPTYAQVLEGVRLVKENNIDLILAVGGGSVIDCAKAISICTHAKGDPFKRYWIDFEDIDNELIPVGAVLTMTGTGSEMNGGSVITNEDLTIKAGRAFPSLVFPKFAIMNPEYTYTVPKIQMVSGIYDIISHLCEQYFSGEDDNTTDYIIEGVLRSLIVCSKKALIDPTDYEARSNIMWCSTLALNTVTGLSKKQDWQVHNIEHQLGAYTDCPHGLGLSVISMPYFRHIYKYGLDKFVRFATNIWGVSVDGKTKEEIALEGIDALASFSKELGIPTTLRELGCTEDMLRKIADTSVLGGGYKSLTPDEVYEILKECY